MPRKLSAEARAHKRKYDTQYIAANYERINILFPPGTRAKIEAAARSGESVSEFVRAAIDRELDARTAGDSDSLKDSSQSN